MLACSLTKIQIFAVPSSDFGNVLFVIDFQQLRVRGVTRYDVVEVPCLQKHDNFKSEVSSYGKVDSASTEEDQKVSSLKHKCIQSEDESQQESNVVVVKLVRVVVHVLHDVH